MPSPPDLNTIGLHVLRILLVAAPISIVDLAEKNGRENQRGDESCDRNDGKSKGSDSKATRGGQVRQRHREGGRSESDGYDIRNAIHDVSPHDPLDPLVHVGCGVRLLAGKDAGHDAGNDGTNEADEAQKWKNKRKEPKGKRDRVKGYDGLDHPDRNRQRASSVGGIAHGDGRCGHRSSGRNFLRWRLVRHDFGWSWKSCLVVTS